MKKLFLILLLLSLSSLAMAQATDLEQILERGELRHLGVPYANFVTGSGSGLSVELMQLFAKHLVVKYRYVNSSWNDIIADLTGQRWELEDGQAVSRGEAPIRGDVISTGLTVIPWRADVLDFSAASFPTQVWLLSRADAAVRPIVSSGDITTDIKGVKALLNNKTLLGKKNTCLDPELYALAEAGAKTENFAGNLNELAPAVLNHDSETILLDVPDALIALDKWPGELLVLGPVSEKQIMAEGFRKSSPHLREAYNQFLEQIYRDGTYLELVRKYYPTVLDYYPDFFTR